MWVCLIFFFRGTEPEPRRWRQWKESNWTPWQSGRGQAKTRGPQAWGFWPWFGGALCNQHAAAWPPCGEPEVSAWWQRCGQQDENGKRFDRCGNQKSSVCECERVWLSGDEPNDGTWAWCRDICHKREWDSQRHLLRPKRGGQSGPISSSWTWYKTCQVVNTWNSPSSKHVSCSSGAWSKLETLPWCLSSQLGKIFFWVT